MKEMTLSPFWLSRGHAQKVLKGLSSCAAVLTPGNALLPPSAGQSQPGEPAVKTAGPGMKTATPETGYIHLNQVPRQTRNLPTSQALTETAQQVTGFKVSNWSTDTLRLDSDQGACPQGPHNHLAF